MRPAPRRLGAVEIADLMTFYKLHAPHRVPLLEAAYAGLITFGEVTRAGTALLKEIDDTDRPALVVIGDDDGIDTGPGGWACAADLACWACAAVVHGAAGTVDSYRDAVRLSIVERRVVLVETGVTLLLAWHQLFADAGVPTVNYYPAEKASPVFPGSREVH